MTVTYFFFHFFLQFLARNTMNIERLTKAVEQEYYRLKEAKKQEADAEVKVVFLNLFCQLLHVC